jgi:hypothetical protein
LKELGIPVFGLNEAELKNFDAEGIPIVVPDFGRAIMDAQSQRRSVMASQGYESEARNVQPIFDSIPSLIHTGRPHGYLDYFKQGWLQYLGLPMEDLLGWKWTGAIHRKMSTPWWTDGAFH